MVNNADLLYENEIALLSPYFCRTADIVRDCTGIMGKPIEIETNCLNLETRKTMNAKQLIDTLPTIDGAKPYAYMVVDGPDETIQVCDEHGDGLIEYYGDFRGG